VPEVTSTLKAEIEALEGPIVVFGAGGFIGANLMRAVLPVRDDCYAVTHRNYVSWRLVDLPARNVLYADLTDPASIGSIFDRHGFRTILQFAAYGGDSRQDDAGLMYRTNVLGLVNLLEVASRRGFSALVHAGSSSEYGLNCRAPKESSELWPNSHYAVTKVAAAYLLRYHGAVKKQPVINLRFYSVYGPLEGPDRLIPRLVEHGIRGVYPPLVDPDISRDFVYVDDAIEATVKGAIIGARRGSGVSVNVATGRKTSIRELAWMMKGLCDIEGEPSFGTMPNRNWDLKDWYGDASEARALLGWEARTSLEEGLGKTLAWQRAEGGLPRAPVTTPLARVSRVSAVIACYRDAQAIPLMHQRLTRTFESMNVDYEIIFVNDASPDDTERVLEETTAGDNHVLAIEHSRNFGSQSAFLSGMHIATGDAVVLLDGDLQDPPEMIPRFYEKWRAGFEVVYGRRAERETGAVLGLCYRTFYKLFRGLSYVSIPLDAGDFSLMDRRVVNELLRLPETDQFLRGLRAWVGFRQTGVDYVRPERVFGETTNNWRRNIWWAKKGIFSFSFVPLELLSYFGVFLTAISFLAMIAQVVGKLIYPETPHGVTTIIVLILFFGGAQILAVSILGEYLMKVFEETKKRPKFIRKAIRWGAKHFTTVEEMEDFLKGR
jgi:polyisoprenyl-phosphate glycosyltransferase